MCVCVCVWTFQTATATTTLPTPKLVWELKQKLQDQWKHNTKKRMQNLFKVRLLPGPAVMSVSLQETEEMESAGGQRNWDV